ncbi:DNA internalization-related competence protein ComEC/Rec2 [Rodentibacter trehalosifermentans]|uniref:DNA internalization-related competence protein ComEC/Rec2 n=1 Tax=Rodentibacter trehalosifermentans TaxID=1908263 RepID=A0A1V3IY66_9PAST|nr:DNA internalization-related competence protein ComEC/Rec2 [Rodentibacter trehalosifermentans]OOF47309.1 DNA internalization-related competence protein ComEC/Rec2 [Rodentibacter trehalosifermentans]OOF49026.1 DNA internalization-related competence protein ComEC/Rec2 [Rodentibacter trehalosifermentans]OOF53364.1 DNA internalization-related competence protein ComEC/Rec2 [Rodentibacter trehalosifermentans]
MPTVFTLAICIIVASLSLIFLPDFMLIGIKPMLLCHLILIPTALCFRYFKRIALFHFFLGVNIFVLALGYVHSFALDLLHQAENISVRKQQLELTIEEILHQQEYQTLIAHTVLEEGGKPQRIFLNWKAKERPFLGQRWRGEVSLRPLSARLNSGGFDRQQWYFSKGVIATGTLKSAVKIGDDFSWREKKLQQTLQQTENLSSQGLLLALAFGERAWLDKTTWQVYRQTNTAHLIAISGLHIGLAMGIGFLLMRMVQFFLPSRFITPFLPLLSGVIFAIFYATLAGISIPTFRAMSALVFVFGLQISRRYYSPFRLFILVVAFLLFCDPLMPLSVSFWLSAGAVCCLIIWYRYLPFSLFQWQHRPFPKKVRWILGLFHLQFGLLLLFTPIQLLLFNGVALNGFLANLIAVPLYSFLLVPLILFAVLTNGAAYAWQLANALAEGITRILAFFQGTWVDISLNFSFILTALSSLFFAFLIYWIYREKPLSPLKPSGFFTLTLQPLPVIQKKQGIGTSIGIALLSLSVFACRQYQKPLWQLDTLDVGQGLATLIVKNGRGILYDSGAAWKGGSMAELEILPYLQREGIQLDKLILSHDDNDHSGGARAILQRFPHVTLISPSEKNYGETDRTFCVAGNKWQWQGLHFQVLSPKTPVKRAENSHSCVILVEDGQYRVLLTGDAEMQNERIFARTLGKIDVLLVGHHGSKTSTGEFLLKQTRPDLAVISAGRWNPWKFPHSSVMERLKQYQSAVENTAVSGQIRVSFYHNKWKVSHQRKAFSPWYARPIGLSTE